MDYRKIITNNRKYKHCETISPGDVRWMLPNAVRGDFDTQAVRRELARLERDGL